MRPDGLFPDRSELSFLRKEVGRLDVLARRRGRALLMAGGALLALGLALGFEEIDVRHQLLSCRAKLVESRQSFSALANARRDATVAPAATSHPTREPRSGPLTIAL